MQTEKRVFDKIRCVCGRDIGKNAIKRHRSLCAAYWKSKYARLEREKKAADMDHVLPVPTRIVRVPFKGEEEE
jgi:hypothetical protein